jgi:hypothetical protein
MSEHTQGEWQLFRNDDREQYSVGIPGDVGIRLIATVDFGYDEPAESEQHANASLITAAPSLLTALETIRDYWNGSRNETAMGDALSHITETARAAIALAKGEKS